MRDARGVVTVLREDRSAAERLSRDVAGIADRLAQLLIGNSASREGPLADGAAFLHAMAEAAGDSRQQGGRPLESPGQSHPLDRLVNAFGLSPVEVDLLLLAGMAEEHEGYASVLRSLHPRGEPRATVGLAAQLCCQTSGERRVLREMLELGPAVRSGALVVGAEGPFFERTLSVADAIWPALGGLDVWPAWLRPLDGRITVNGLEEWFATPEVVTAAAALRGGEPRLIFIAAESENVAMHRAAALAQHAGLASVRFSLPANNPRDDAERTAGLHALLRGAVPIARLPAPDGPTLVEAPQFRAFPGPVVVCARGGAAVLHGDRPVLTVPVDRLSCAARQRLWRETLPELAAESPRLAARYALEPLAALEVAADVRSLEALGDGGVGLAEVAAIVRGRSNLALSAGVKLVRPAARWEHLVLRPDRLVQLHEALARLVNQAKVLDEWGFLEDRPGARGVRMLFCGPPGTGKSLSAEVLAQALGVDLLVVDISRVVSKWIGETEKNLAEVFDAAERAQAVLLFDEADALFSRRTEVTDAHDRYANLETAYLLSRLERFEGLAILATNLRQNIDPAFTRRMEFIVDFEEPSAPERVALWRAHLPPRAPLGEDVDLAELAALYPIVGGLIRNAAVAAGFLATSDDSPITRNHFVRAVRREYEKSGKAFPGAPAGSAAQ